MQKQPIGVIDSGVGGITVWAEIVGLLPEWPTVYLADTAHCPYGGRSDKEIVELTRICVERLVADYGVRLIVLACNTITAAAVDILRNAYPEIEFVGMEPAVKPAAQTTQSGVVGILATRATLRGRLYHDTSHRWAEGIRLIEMAGDGLVEMVERGKVGQVECDTLLKQYIGPMIEAGADMVVLGCTHYPFLTESIVRLSAGQLRVIQPARAIAERVRFLLDRRCNQPAQPPHTPSNSATHHAQQPSKPKTTEQLAAGFGTQYRFISSIDTPAETQRIEQLARYYYQTITE